MEQFDWGLLRGLLESENQFAWSHRRCQGRTLALCSAPMRFTPAFYRVAATCSFASAITTLGLIFLPEMMAPAEDFAARMARVNDPAYRVYAWVYLVHPFLTVTAALAVAGRAARRRRS